MSPRRALIILVGLVSVGWGIAALTLMSRWVASSAAVASVAGALVLWRSHRELRGLCSVSTRALGAGLAAGLALTLATEFGYPITVALVPSLREQVGALYRVLAMDLPLPLHVALVSYVGVVEEMLWRGPVLEALGAERGGATRVLAVLASSTLYGAAQLGFGEPVLAFTAFALGACWATVRLFSGSLLAPVLAHLVWQLGVLFAAPLPH